MTQTIEPHVSSGDDGERRPPSPRAYPGQAAYPGQPAPSPYGSTAPYVAPSPYAAAPVEPAPSPYGAPASPYAPAADDPFPTEVRTAPPAPPAPRRRDVRRGETPPGGTPPPTSRRSRRAEPAARTRSERRDHDEDARPGRSARTARSARSGRPGYLAYIGILRRVGSTIGEVVILMAIALLVTLGIKTFLVQPFKIPSESMRNTLQVEDRILVSKLTPGVLSLHRGDVIVFSDPGDWLPPQTQARRSGLTGALHDTFVFVGILPEDTSQHLVKRVIGLPGDKVVCCDKKKRITVNGVAVNEPYVVDNGSPRVHQAFSVTVRANHVWVMGDNRGNSEDSRFHPTLDNGQVPESDIVGKAFVIAWPLSRFGGVAEPDVFATVPDPKGRG